MFAFLQQRGVIEQNPIAPIRAIRLSGEHVQGPYTEQQLKKIFAHIHDVVPPTIPADEKKVYGTRLHAFLLLLLHTGCDVIDGGFFRQERISLPDQNSEVLNDALDY